MTIQPVQFGENEFCGQAVVSIITGRTTDKAEKKFQELRDNFNKPIKGIWLRELEIVLGRFGYSWKGIPYVKGTLFTNLSMINNTGIYVFSLYDHVVVLERTYRDWLLCDNHTKKPMLSSNPVSNATVLGGEAAIHAAAVDKLYRNHPKLAILAGLAGIGVEGFATAHNLKENK